jgi:peptide/nickel transport system ATP-binding protein
MYAGRIVERAAANSLFRAPRHPYTLGLLSSFPPLHGAHRQMTGIPGSPPDLRALPRGCVFHPRCGYAMDRCRTQAPPLVPLPGQGGRLAACWLQEPGVPPPPELDLADPGLAGSPAPARPAASVAGQDPPPDSGGGVSAAGGAPPPAPVAAAGGAPPPEPVAAAPTAAATVAENLGARDD